MNEVAIKKTLFFHVIDNRELSFCVRHRVGKERCWAIMVRFVVSREKRCVTLTLIWNEKCLVAEWKSLSVGSARNVAKRIEQGTWSIVNSLCHFELVKLITLNEWTRNVKWHWVSNRESNFDRSMVLSYSDKHVL